MKVRVTTAGGFAAFQTVAEGSLDDDSDVARRLLERLATRTPPTPFFGQAVDAQQTTVEIEDADGRIERIAIDEAAAEPELLDVLDEVRSRLHDARLGAIIDGEDESGPTTPPG